VLVVNSTEVDSKMITLAPAETKEVEFIISLLFPQAIIPVEILGQKGMLQIEQKIAMPAYEAVLAIGILLVLALVLRRRTS